MVGEERVFVGCLGGGRVQMVCEEPRRDRMCVCGKGLKNLSLCSCK